MKILLRYSANNYLSIMASSRYLDVEFGRSGALDVVGIRRESLADGSARPAVLVYNLAAASGVQLCLEHPVQFAPNRLEELVGLDSLHQVVWLSFLLDDGAGLVAEDSDFLVSELSGDAGGTQPHDDLFCNHEGELIHGD